MIQKMNFYEAWIAENEKVVFSYMLLIGLLILSVAYAVTELI